MATASQNPTQNLPPVTVFTARRIITMDPANPSAEAVAVADGRILGVGSLDELSGWREVASGYTVDHRFADMVLTPGFIEAHSHVMAGGMWALPYVGFFDRRAPDGKLWQGCGSIDAVIDRLIEVEQAMERAGAAPEETLLAWGLDPIYFEGERLDAFHLDRVSLTRPIFVYHASAHLATVNTALMERAGITSDTATPGVSKRADGEPDGELQEPPAMILAREAFARIRSALSSTEAIQNYGSEARNAGLTLVTDLGTSQLQDPERLAQWQETVNDPAYPCRAMVAVSSMFGGSGDPAELARLGAELRSESTDKLRFGIVKLVLDGSIQGFTARISWPHYFHPPEGHPGNGIWLMAPPQVAEVLAAYHRAGLTVHVHCNGDEATEVFIDAVEQVLAENPRWDHRHTVQHCQLTTKAQYKRMAALGMCANIFSNHIFYWGDQHRDITVGADRAAGMDACATAAREGVSFTIHSDAPVTPLGPLHTAWCAVNRLTASGEVLGPDERISAERALEAITLGAAFQLKLDHDLGSIETGKLADFTVLAEDPLTVDPERLRDIEVWGTVLGGIPQPASTA